jgi:hypothetical protein
MIFVSDYDGDHDEYLAAFGLGIPAGMRWTFGSFDGFPGPYPTRPFQEYVADGESEVLLRFSAYPGATVRDLDMALAVGDRWHRLCEARAQGRTVDAESVCLELLRALSLAPAGQPPSLWGGIWQGLRHRPTGNGLVLALPLDRVAWAEGGGRRVQGLAGEENWRDLSPFAAVAGLHFARVTVIRTVPRRGEGPREHLLLAAWVDGDPKDAARRLAEAFTAEGPRGPWADDLWGSCTGYPGSTDLERLTAWLLGHRLRFSLYLDSRAGSTAGELREALDLKQQVDKVVARHEGRPLAELTAALAALDW